MENKLEVGPRILLLVFSTLRKCADVLDPLGGGVVVSVLRSEYPDVLRKYAKMILVLNSALCLLSLH
jgi:hypothetical protein